MGAVRAAVGVAGMLVGIAGATGLWGAATTPSGTRAAMTRAASGPSLVMVEPTTQAAVEVGQPITVKAFLENRTGRGFAIPIAGDRLKRSLQVHVSISKFPGAPDPSGASGPGGGAGGGNGEPKNAFVTIQPGGKSPEIADEMTAMVPGELWLGVFYLNREGTYTVNESGRDYVRYPVPDVWTGSVYAEVVLKVPNQLGAASAQALKARSDFVLNDANPLVDRALKLHEIAGLRHYFAARCVRDLWKATKGPLQDRALDDLVDLFDYGTAYEAYGDMVKVLADEATPDDMKVKLLGTFKRMSLTWVAPGISIARQAYYDLSKEQVAAAIEVLKKLAGDKNPRVALAAREIMEGK